MPEVILPCPACGMKYNEKAPMLYVESVDCEDDGCFVVCKNCGARGPVSYVEENNWFGHAMPEEVEKAEAAAIAAWNTLPSALTWTNEPPKVAGWYWRQLDGHAPNLKKVESGFDGEEYLGVRDGWYVDRITRKDFVKWAGPIPMPGGGVKCSTHCEPRFSGS